MEPGMGPPDVEKKLRAVSNPKSRAGFQLGGHPGYEDVPTSGTGPPDASNCEAFCLVGPPASTAPSLPGGIGSEGWFGHTAELAADVEAGAPHHRQVGC